MAGSNGSTAASGLSFVPSDLAANAAAAPRASLTVATPLRGSADPSEAMSVGALARGAGEVTGLLFFTVMWDDLLNHSIPSSPGLDVLLTCTEPASAPSPGLSADTRTSSFSLRSTASGVKSVGWGDALGPRTGRFRDLSRAVAFPFLDVRFVITVRVGVGVG